MRTAWLALFLVACGGGGDDDTTYDPPGSPPAAPAANDPAFQFAIKQWNLVGNDLTPGDDSLEVKVVGPADVVDMWLDGGAGVRLTLDGGIFKTTADISSLAVGAHEIMLAADGKDTAFVKFTIYRSHPLYVMVTTDWDDPDNRDDQLARHVELHEAHPQMRITHFPGPYTFTDPGVTTARQEQLAAWLRNMRDTYGDEIGLHIHPWCSFVEAAGVTCRTTPSLAQSSDSSGYTVAVSAYTEAEVGQMLDKVDDIFVAHDLGKPITFRTGAWSAEPQTFRALSSHGYVADTSALNYKRIEEWQGFGTLYTYCAEHWSEIGDTSQPYYPAQDNTQHTGTPSLTMLEVPDNGAMVDYVSAEEMIEIFHAIWGDGPLTEPRAVMIGFHPPNFDEAFKLRIDGALTEYDKFLAATGGGPVVYALLRDMPKVWKRP